MVFLLSLRFAALDRRLDPSLPVRGAKHGQEELDVVRRGRCRCVEKERRETGMKTG